MIMVELIMQFLTLFSLIYFSLLILEHFSSKRNENEEQVMITECAVHNSIADI
jgi:hypothetical protein